MYIGCIMCIDNCMSNSTLCVLSIYMYVYFAHCHLYKSVSMYCLYVYCFCTVWRPLSRISLTKAHVLWWCDNKSDLIWLDIIFYKQVPKSFNSTVALQVCFLYLYYLLIYLYMIWYDMIWYHIIWYGMVWYDMIWYDMIYSILFY